MSNISDISELSDLFKEWETDNNGIKKAFIELINLLDSLEGLTFSFKSRPGITHSLRANVNNSDQKILTLADIIDDDPENRWLSICFYAETINDPNEEGDLIPGGLMGEDGYCFDLFENSDEMVDYLKERIKEAHGKYFQ